MDIASLFALDSVVFKLVIALTRKFEIYETRIFNNRVQNDLFGGRNPVFGGGG